MTHFTNYTYYTKKTDRGFTATVVGYDSLKARHPVTGNFATPQTVIQERTFATRARATGFARRWTGYYRAQNKDVA